MAWIRDTDSTLHLVDLKDKAKTKREQLEQLKALQGETRAKEFELDAVTERAQQLNKGLTGRSSQVSEIGVKYQQVCHKVKELAAKWQQYVNNHEDFDSKVADCTQWLDDIRQKLNYCSDLSTASQKDLENKLETVQTLILYREEGFSKIQNLVETAQVVLANTAPSGHDNINQTLSKLQSDWSNLASKMIEVKTTLDDAITKWASLLEQTQGLNKTIEWMQNELATLSEFQNSIPEKKNQLDAIKNVDERARCEKIEVDNLMTKTVELLSSGQQGQAATEAKVILDTFYDLADKLSVSFHGFRKNKMIILFV